MLIDLTYLIHRRRFKYYSDADPKMRNFFVEFSVDKDGKNSEVHSYSKGDAAQIRAYAEL